MQNERKLFQKISRKTFNKNKANKGITLIALVISIIVMLILAGVSLNAVIGDNGIITQAQNATYMQSVAVLEEYLNSYYVEHYEEIESIETENKAEVLASLSESGNWFYKTAIGYVVDENGKAHYFLKIDKMPEEIKSQIKGGSSEGKTLADYKKCIDVYGVTKDLKVYYCSGGTDTIIGESYEQIAEDNPLREVFPAGSTWSKLIKGNDTENVTAAEMKSIKDLTIDENSGITNLSELYNFTSLKNITINNVNMASLDGIENATQLQYVYLKNSTIGDYKGISKLSRLTYLYMERNGNTEEADNGEVDKLFTGLEGANLSNLQYFGIFGVDQRNYYYESDSYSTYSSDVTNINGFSKLGESTKKAIKYLYLNNNRIEDLSSIAECENLELLRVEGNLETSLNYISSMNKLIYLTVANMKLNDISVFASDSFSRLDYLNIKDNKELEDCSPLKNINSLRYLYLAGCSNLDVVKVEEIADFYNAIASKNIDSKYSDYLQGSTKRVYDNKNLADTSEPILALKNMSVENKLKIKQISLVNNSQLTDNCLNEILGSGFTNLESLDVRGCTGLKNLDFLEGLPNLKELLIDDTGIVREEVEEIDNNCSKIATISINTEVDLTKMQKTISGLYSNRVGNYKKLNRSYGFVISENLVKQLEQCTQITSLQVYGVPNIEETVDLSGCIKLEKIDITENTIKFILPEGLKTLTGQNYTIPNIDLCINTIETIQQNQMREATTVEDFTEMCKKLSNSTSLKTMSFTPMVDFDFSGLKYLSKSNINTIAITRNPSWFGTFTNMKNVDLRKPSDYIEGTPHFNNLKNLTLEYTTIESMENFKDCTALENISITNSTINDISALANMPNLKTINFSNNNIVNLEPIQNLNNLSTLNLSNNSIYNTYLSVDNLSILSNLNRNHSLKTLYLKGNNIDDYSQLDGLSWTAKDW